MSTAWGARAVRSMGGAPHLRTEGGGLGLRPGPPSSPLEDREPPAAGHGVGVVRAERGVVVLVGAGGEWLCPVVVAHGVFFRAG